MNSMYDWKTVDKDDLKKDLRYSLKNKLLNAFGKNLSEATCKEKKTVVGWIEEEYVGFGYGKYGNDFNLFFKKVFEKEIKECEK